MSSVRAGAVSPTQRGALLALTEVDDADADSDERSAAALARLHLQVCGARCVSFGIRGLLRSDGCAGEAVTGAICRCGCGCYHGCEHVLRMRARKLCGHSERRVLCRKSERSSSHRRIWTICSKPRRESHLPVWPPCAVGSGWQDVLNHLLVDTRARATAKLQSACRPRCATLASCALRLAVEPLVRGGTLDAEAEASVGAAVAVRVVLCVYGLVLVCARPGVPLCLWLCACVRS